MRNQVNGFMIQTPSATTMEIASGLVGRRPRAKVGPRHRHIPRKFSPTPYVRSTAAITKQFAWCSCYSLNEALLRNGWFPSQSTGYAFHTDFFEDLRKYNLRNGVPCYTTSAILLGNVGISI